ncbi:hypothetical protein ABPG72_015929 [Tetrahymena utriculariae]
MINRLLKNFDIFGQSFQFNSAKQELRKRTCVGGFLTLLIIMITLIYFLYLNYKYFMNQFAPKFRSQTFVVNDNVDIPLNNDLIGFQISSYFGDGTLDYLEAQKNKTYLVFIPLLTQMNQGTSNYTQIDIIQCSNPQLKGYKCLDLQKLPFQYLRKNSQIQYFLNIQTYRCHDTDGLKRTIPDNCASEEEINNYLSDKTKNIDIKIYTSQYNITSKSIQTNFKHQIMFLPTNQVTNFEVRVQKHITTVKDGLLIQGEQLYTSPISYIINQQIHGSYQDLNKPQVFDKSIFSLGYSIDEMVQFVDIEFPTYPEILALCNSTLALLMCLGFLGRQFAQQIITQELFLFTLQNIYQGTFQKILKVNNLQVYHDIIQLEGLSQNFQTQNQSNEEHQGQVCVPFITAKQQEFRLNSKKRIAYNDKFQDEIKESVTSEMNDQYSPKSSIVSNSSHLNQEKFLFQPQIVFASKLKDCQSIKEDIELQNSQQINKLQNIQVESKMQDLCKKQNLLNSSIRSRIYNQELSKKIEDKLFTLKLFNKKKGFEKKGLNQIAVQSINRQVANTLDFLSFYKDILLFKKAIMVLLSKEQLAALELVSCTDMFLEDGNIDKIVDHKGNHFEQQLTISQSEELKCKYIQDFINQCQQSQNLSSLDQRIFSSLI